MKTIAEIKNEIDALKKLQPRIEKEKPETYFGDNNVDAIAAEIWVLEQTIKNTGICIPPKNEKIDERYNNGDGENFVLQSAFDAVGWIEENSDIKSLAAEWLELLD